MSTNDHYSSFICVMCRISVAGRSTKVCDISPSQQILYGPEAILCRPGPVCDICHMTCTMIKKKYFVRNNN